MPAAGYIVVNFEFRKEGRRWAAYCEELGTATFGRSIPEAKKKIQEAVLLHLNTLEEVGERERFFREHSIKFLRTRPVKNIIRRSPLRRESFYSTHVQPIPASVN